MKSAGQRALFESAVRAKLCAVAAAPANGSEADVWIRNRSSCKKAISINQSIHDLREISVSEAYRSQQL